MADRPSDHLRRAQELLRVLRRRGRGPADPAEVEEFAAAAGLPVGAVAAAVRGQVGEPRLLLPGDGSLPVGPGIQTHETAVHRVGASPVLVAELGVEPGGPVVVREVVVRRHGIAVQFRSSSSGGSDQVAVHHGVVERAVVPVRPVDVEAVRADEQTARALEVPPGTVVLLQVVLADGPGGRRVDFAYSRADLVRIETR